METLIASKVIEALVDKVAKIFRRSRIVLKTPFVEWEINTASQSIDERIAKLDDAREALSQGLEDISELRADASRHKQEVQNAIKDLSVLSSETEQLEAKRSAISQILESEVSAFQIVAGIPSETQRRRDKVHGFVSGVLASMVASGLIYAGVLVYNAWKPNSTPQNKQVEQAASAEQKALQ